MYFCQLKTGPLWVEEDCSFQLQNPQFEFDILNSRFRIPFFEFKIPTFEFKIPKKSEKNQFELFSPKPESGPLIQVLGCFVILLTSGSRDRAQRSCSSG